MRDAILLLRVICEEFDGVGSLLDIGMSNTHKNDNIAIHELIGDHITRFLNDLHGLKNLFFAKLSENIVYKFYPHHSKQLIELIETNKREAKESFKELISFDFRLNDKNQQTLVNETEKLLRVAGLLYTDRSSGIHTSPSTSPRTTREPVYSSHVKGQKGESEGFRFAQDLKKIDDSEQFELSFNERQPLRQKVLNLYTPGDKNIVNKNQVNMLLVDKENIPINSSLQNHNLFTLPTTQLNHQTSVSSSTDSLLEKPSFIDLDGKEITYSVQKNVDVEKLQVKQFHTLNRFSRCIAPINQNEGYIGTWGDGLYRYRFSGNDSIEEFEKIQSKE